MLLHVNFEQAIRLEDLIAVQAGSDLAVKVDEAVDPQFLLHLEENVALVALEVGLRVVVLVRHVVMVVAGGFGGEEARAVRAGERKLFAVLGREMIVEQSFLTEDASANAANVLLDVLKMN